MTFGGTINFICQNKNQVGLYQGEELLLKIDSDPKLKVCWFVSVNGCPAPPQITWSSILFNFSHLEDVFLE